MASRRNQEGAPEWNDKIKVEIRIVINKGYVGRLIGKKGANIKNVLKVSKARLDFGPDFPPCERLGRRLQEAKIKGNLNQLKKAITIIGETTVKTDELGADKNESTLTSAKAGDLQLSVCLPADNIAMVIGKRGARIKQITKDSSTKIDVQEEEWSGVKCVTFTGSPENVANGITLTLQGLPLGVFKPQSVFGGPGEWIAIRPQGGGQPQGGGRPQGGGYRDDSYDRGGPPPPARGAPRYDDRGYYDDRRPPARPREELDNLRHQVYALEDQLRAPPARDPYYPPAPRDPYYPPRDRYAPPDRDPRGYAPVRGPPRAGRRGGYPY